MNREACVEHARQTGHAAPDHPKDAETLAALIAEGMAIIRQDLAGARRLAMAARAIAKHLRDSIGQGQAERLQGHVELLSGRSAAAVRWYSKARSKFAQEPLERAATAVAMLQGLAYLGRYDEAFQVATEALDTFRKQGDEFRAARVEANLANALHRLDRLEEARKHYREAIAVIERHQAIPDLAIVSRNYGVCLMGLLEFEEAESMYASARAVFEAAGDRSLLLEIDLNRAYLLGRRGQMREALTLYRVLREGLPEEMSYELGHCFLDQADLLLESGLWTDSLLAARQALVVFEKIGSGFENGKARLIEAIAAERLGDSIAAVKGLKEARRRLARVPNQNWKAMAHLAQAEQLENRGQLRAALRSLLKAEASGLAPERLPLLREKLAFLAVELQHEDTLSRLELPPAVSAKRSRQLGRSDDAEHWARRALSQYDRERQALPAARLRQAVALSKQRSLVECFRALRDPAERLQVVMRLKNQALAEVMLSPETSFVEAASGLDRASHLTESQNLAITESFIQAEVEQAPSGTHLVELFADQGQALAFLVRGSEVTEVSLGTVHEWERLGRSFRLHLRRSREGAGAAVEDSLAQVYALLQPVLEGAAEVVLGRHGFARGLPLHALKTPFGWLGNTLHLSYAPSLSSWWAGQKRKQPIGAAKVAFGEPDVDAPAMQREAVQVAQLIGGRTAGVAELPQAVSEAGLLHIAAHGLHREDNPRFSSLRLGSHTFDLIDVLQWRCRAGLVTLSGCSTASASPGDTRDPEGFVEAFLVAGSQAVLASLWDVADEPALDWMTSFYENLSEGATVALRRANQRTRETWPHPAHWAAFALFGNSEFSCESWPLVVP